MSSTFLPLSGLQVERKEDVIHRPLADYHPTVWGDYFITHSPPSQPSEMEMKERVEDLVREVKVMLLREHTLKESMQLIDAVQRLGVSYHFEEEIDVVLSKMVLDDSNDDLFAVSLWFRLLRQHGHRVSSDVFNRFRGGDGKFKASLSSDARGLLSLYEASYLGTPGEEILEHAIDFTTNHLKSVVDHLELPLAALVSRALETPLIRRFRRLEMRHYISIYQDDKELRNDVLLELGKLDYNLVQLLHWEEARHITAWMNELGLMQKLTFVRNRVVELFYWVTMIYHEPCYSRGRIMTTKVICMLSIMDDLFDAYGTLEEVIHYEAAIQRWELEDAYQLPEYFKDHLLAMINTLKGFENELAIENKLYRIPYIKNSMKEIAKSYLEEIKWREENMVPSMEENLRVSLITAGCSVLACASYVGMGELTTKDAFDWVISFPKIIKASSIITRLMDDITSHEFEQKRAHSASTVECYMKEHGTSKQEAYKNLKKMIEDSWKVINEECLVPTDVSMPLMMPIFNITRVMEALYKYIDGYTNSKVFVKDDIFFVLVHPIKI